MLFEILIKNCLLLHEKMANPSPLYRLYTGICANSQDTSMLLMYRMAVLQYGNKHSVDTLFKK